MKDRISKLQGHVDVLLNAYFGLRGNIEIYKPVYDAAVVSEHQIGDLARGFLFVRRTLIVSCVLDISRLAFDNDSRVPSVHNLIEALDDSNLRAGLRNQFLDGAKFDRTLEGLLNNWNEFRRRPWVAPFQTMRDKWIAHLEVRRENGEYRPLDISKLGLKWGDPEDAALLLEPIILDLVAVYTTRGHIISAVMEANQRAGRAFWGLPAIAAPITKERDGRQ